MFTETQCGWGWKGPLEVIWAKPGCSSRATYSWLPRTMSRWFLNISEKGNSTTSNNVSHIFFSHTDAELIKYN